MQSKQPSIKDIQMLRYKLTELWDDLKEGKVNASEAKAFTGIATAVIKTVAVEQLQGQITGNVKEIDFISDNKTVRSANNIER